MARTRDGIRLSDIVHAAEEKGICVRPGSKHRYVLTLEYHRPCPLAESTDARRMIVPWMREALGYDNNTIYQALRDGTWE